MVNIFHKIKNQFSSFKSDVLGFYMRLNKHLTDNELFFGLGLFWNKYKSVFSYSWRNRKQLDGVSRTRDESEFLPSVIAIQNTPVLPMLNWGIWSIVVISVLALLITIFFRVDIISSAQGVLVPAGQIKTIQTLESAVVSAIHVKDGQKVHAGDLLAELFIPGVPSDTTRWRSELSSLKNDIDITDSFLSFLDSGVEGPKIKANGDPLLYAKYKNHVDKIFQYSSNLAQRRAELMTSSQSVDKIKAQIPMLISKVSDFKELESKGYISRHALLDQAQQLTDVENDLKISNNRVREQIAAVQQAKAGLDFVVSELKLQMLERRKELSVKMDALDSELEKAIRRDELLSVRSPVDGVVSNLSVFTVGGVVTAANALMLIVPESGVLEVDAMLENKDVGHVQIGMPVQVKLDTYPFTRYGVMLGRVSDVSATTLTDKDNKDLSYKVRITLPGDIERRASFPYALSSGMKATAEIKIGTRRLIEYILSPLVTSVKEAAHER